MRLGPVADLPAAAGNKQLLLTKIVAAFKGHPALCAYKGIDEPRNPFRGAKWIRPAGLVRAHTKVKALDPKHPLVIIQAPRSPVSQLVPYRPAFDITGVDIFPVAYPPGLHCDNGNTDISVVGDMAAKMKEVAGGKPFWMTLQIAWSGMAPSKKSPGSRAPLPVAQAGAVHGLPGDRERRARARLLRRPHDRGVHARRRQGRLELDVLAAGAAARRARADLQPAAAGAARSGLEDPGAHQAAHLGGDRHRAGRAARRHHLYVIAVKRGGSPARIEFTGLPKRQNGAPLTKGEVLFEYVQRPLPDPRRRDRQVLRPVKVSAGGFRDWFSAHDAHVYRFDLA